MKVLKIVDIKSIEHNSKRYDIETRDNHNFFANGILVHNCGTCSERTLAFMENGLTDPALTGGEWEEAVEYANKIYGK